MAQRKYSYFVTVQQPHTPSVDVYRGNDLAEAMVAWSKAISEGVEYVELEALGDREDT
jgi:hypothetical protein